MGKQTATGNWGLGDPGRYLGGNNSSKKPPWRMWNMFEEIVILGGFQNTLRQNYYSALREILD